MSGERMNRRQRRAVAREKREKAAQPTNTNRPTIAGLIPSGLLLRFELPAGTPDFGDTIRAAHIHAIKATAVFEKLPDDERNATLTSLACSIRRANYHRGRYEAIRQTLDEHRHDMPGEVLWDELVQAVHFELQALCAACRSVVDEVVYLIARRHGITNERARNKVWEPAELVTKPLPTECDVEDVHVLRSHAPWFGTVNAYRNSVVHRGWRHGSGHYDPDYLGAASNEPSSNALLVPDEKSLARKSKPFEWTYDDGTTVDDVAKIAWDGLCAFLLELCEKPWQTPTPAPGTKPRAEHPNAIVALIRPVIIATEQTLFLPVFSTLAAAQAFETLRSQPNFEIVAANGSTLWLGTPAAMFSLHGVTSPSGKVHVLLDPEATSDWTHVRTKARSDFELAELAKLGPCMPVNLALVGLERVFVWTEPRRWQWT